VKLINTTFELLNLPEFNLATIAFFTSFILSIALVLSKSCHGVFSMDSTVGIQKSHTQATPRIGGIAIILSLVWSCGKASTDIQTILMPILFAGMPAFLFGIAEDFTKKISILQRLLATIASGFLAWWITDYSLSRLNIWGLDMLMQFTFFSVIFTMFAVGGVANSINIIDGFNGYASLTCFIAFIGFAMIAFQLGDLKLALVSVILAASVFGFFWVNWPFGKIFLGDGGAYFLGFAQAWIAVLLIERNTSASAFSALLVCILPITEVILSIFRRQVRKQHPGKADRMHFHNMLHRRYIIRWLSKWPSTAKNSLVGIIIGLTNLIPAIVAYYSYESTLFCLIASLIFVFLYVAIFARMVKFYWCSPIAFLILKPKQN